jgi:hypothetical protein
MPNQPIPIEQANEMIAAYIKYMEGLGVDMTKQTQSVSFTFAELQAWQQLVEPYTDELRICLGVYTTGENAGRITTILWPYKNGTPAVTLTGMDPGGIKPYNDGHITP